MRYRIGIDLGGTNIASGVVEDDSIVSHASIPTGTDHRPEVLAHRMEESARLAAQNAGISMDRVEWVGIGSPGAINSVTGTVEYYGGFHFVHVPLRSLMEQRMGLPVFLENDANAAALAEAVLGAGRGAQSLIAVTIGTGIGGGIILGGKVYSGHNFAGGELGHMVIVEGGKPCPCGWHGCFEAYASASAIIRMTKEAMQWDENTLLWKLAGGDLSNVNGKLMFDGAKKGDGVSVRLFEEYVRYLGCGIVNIINIFQPEIICIGGGVSAQGDFLLDPLREYVNRYDYARFSKNRTKVITAQLGNDAGILGAALLGCQSDKL